MRLDAAVAIKELVGALAELRAEGKVRHIGLCNVNRDRLERAQAVVLVGLRESRRG
jgi:aryl-alcohol dehydrogenase-like predicted oxidoreductase